MTDPVPSVPPVLRETVPTPQPGFLRALRGVWLLTWRSQLTWRRVPMAILGLLVLPFLVYVTTAPRIWTQRESRFSDPGMHFRNFSKHLARSGVPLKPDQDAQLRQIFIEEFQRAEIEWQQQAMNSRAASGREGEQIKSCYEGIQTRARSVLDQGQFSEFQSFGKQYIRTRVNNASEPRWSRSTAFFNWLISFYFLIVLPLNCVRLTGALIRDELQADTLGFLTTRPLSRARLVIAKYLSQTAWLQIVLLIETLLLFGVGAARQIPDLGGVLMLFLTAQFLAVLTWSALGLFLGLVSKRYILIALLYGGIVEIGIGSIPTNINTLSVMSHLKSLLSRNDTLQDIFEYASKGVPFSVSALLVAAGVFLTFAALLFTFREYHHTVEIQK